METLAVIITAALSLFGVVVGAGLQYYFSRAAESRRNQDALRTQAYIDYLRCVAESAQPGIDSRKRTEIFSRAADAKARISIYGSKDVIGVLAEFERGDPRIASRSSADRFLQLTQAMRSDSIGNKESVSIDDLSSVLFGPGFIEP